VRALPKCKAPVGEGASRVREADMVCMLNAESQRAAEKLNN